MIKNWLKIISGLLHKIFSLDKSGNEGKMEAFEEKNNIKFS